MQGLTITATNLISLRIPTVDRVLCLSRRHHLCILLGNRAITLAGTGYAETHLKATLKAAEMAGCTYFLSCGNGETVGCYAVWLRVRRW
ncbi:hypothetical protein KCP69_10160 [Salmonella enterica subsp. enterica]|nr:hypothetical protein KCP69_10160 [Salmonella enterica subsp. enterica]